MSKRVWGFESVGRVYVRWFDDEEGAVKMNLSMDRMYQ